MWDKGKAFPVEFKKMAGQDLFAVVDNVTPLNDITSRVLEALNSLKSLKEANEEKEALKVAVELLKVIISFSYVAYL